jgi:hypothetical protein
MMVKAGNTNKSIMRLLFFIFNGLFILSFNDSIAQQVEDFKWKKRVLIVKTSELSNGTFSKQIEALSNEKKALIERKLVLYKVKNGDIELIDFELNKQKVLNKIEVETKNKFFESVNGFEVTLIGLDGRIKLRQNKFLSVEELSALIDVMPMRQSELKTKN